MSLYEIISIMIEIDQKANKKGREVSDDEWTQAEDLLFSVTMNDPNVRLN